MAGTEGDRNLRTGGTHRWWGWWVVWWSCVGVCQAAGKKDCEDDTDAAVVAAVSVAATLVVVAIVLIIVYIVLRRRHGGFLLAPKRTRKSLMDPEEDGGRITQRSNSCYDNPAFSARDGRDLEEGGYNLSPKRNTSSGMKSPSKGEEQRRTSVSLQRDVPDGRYRRGSSGSLNNCSGPETVSVCLQSQDIIGLGFNISGNMRDGIYVSQVHNRGPAVESGKIQVGDRIRSVTITYDNMVYEDALTVLSYASPYPVQVTVQKERAPSAGSRSGSSEQLNHPLYRSQSLDALPHMYRDTNVIRPKRSQSEMKSETRKDSPRTGETARKTRALSQTLPAMRWEGTVPDVLGVHSDVMVHSADTVGSNFHPAGYQHTQDVIVSAKNKDVEHAVSPVSPSQTEERPEATRHRKKSKLDTEAARGFVSLMDQMLDNADKKSKDDDTFLPQAAPMVGTSPKTPPSKPERKKKPSNGSSVAEDNCLEISSSDGDVEDVCEAVKTVQVHALPTRTQDLGPEVEEEEIRPAHVKREVIINIDGFDFAPVEKPDPETEETDRPKSPNRYVYVKKPSRPASPDGDTVGEDLIEAVLVSRDTQAAPPRSSKAKHTTNYAVQQQATSALDEEDLEGLILKTPSAAASGNLGTMGSGRNPQFVTLDFSGMNETGDRAYVLRNPQSDSQLLHHSEDGRKTEDNREDSLDWSGKRLVRSGSFPEIPQDDSVSDWTDRNTPNDDDSTTSGKRSAADTNVESDLEADPSQTLPSRDIFKARENLADLSDLSISISSSRSSSPGLTNGPSTEGVSLLLPGNNTRGGWTVVELTPTGDSNANVKTVDYTVNASDGENDC